MFNSKMCLVRHIKNTNKNNILKIYVCNYAQLLQDIRNVLFILNRFKSDREIISTVLEDALLRYRNQLRTEQDRIRPF
jgi:hypothetical protein